MLFGSDILLGTMYGDTNHSTLVMEIYCAVCSSDAGDATISSTGGETSYRSDAGVATLCGTSYVAVGYTNGAAI